MKETKFLNNIGYDILHYGIYRVYMNINASTQVKHTSTIYNYDNSRRRVIIFDVGTIIIMLR